MVYRVLISGAALLGLAACGGGGAGSLAGDFASLQNAAASVENAYDASPKVDVTSIPGSGAATFDGYVIIADEFPRNPGETSYASSVSLTANWAGDSISGTASNFFITENDSDGNPGLPAASVAGDVSFDGDLSGTLAGFEVAVTGNLSTNGSGAAEATIDDVAFGSFEGDNSSDPEFVTISGNELAISGSVFGDNDVDLFLRARD